MVNVEIDGERKQLKQGWCELHLAFYDYTASWDDNEFGFFYMTVI